MKTKIINEALKMFYEEGTDFKLSDLATHLSISKKTIYKYFKNKEDILLYCVDMVFDGVHKEQNNIFNDTSLDELTRLKKLVQAMPKEFSSINLSYLNELKKEYPLVHEKVKHYLESDWDQTFEMIDICKEKKLIKNIDNNIFKIMFIGCCEKIIDIADTTVKYELVEEQVLDIIISGIKNV